MTRPIGDLPRSLLEDWTWQERGSCRRSEPEIFSPEDAGRSGLRAREERAKQICRTCPVLVRCREHALAAGETHGVWGAMSARARSRMSAAGAWTHTSATAPPARTGG